MSITLIPVVQQHLRQHKLLLLHGPKQSGRTNLLREAIGSEKKVKVFHLEDQHTLKLFKQIDPASLRKLFGSYDYVILHEAQQLRKLQELLEVILFEDWLLNVLCICSAEPHLDDVLNEVLSSQGLILTTSAPSFKDLAQQEGPATFDRHLDRRLVYGHLVDISLPESELELELQQRVLDIVETPFRGKDRINKQQVIGKLLAYLALHAGSCISYNELATHCEVDNETMRRYIQLLEQAHVLLALPAFHHSLRYELKKSHQIYFYDNGIRNALLRNFAPLDLRGDVDLLWKNWLIAERHKRNLNKNQASKSYFWMSHTRQQVDYIEEQANGVVAYQCQWNKKKRKTFPLLFQKYYPKSRLVQLDRSSYWTFLNKD